MKKIWTISIFIILIMQTIMCFAGTANDLIIMQDIGQYKLMGNGGGQGSGFLGATGHFNRDHLDESYSCMYFNETAEIGLNLEISKHSGVDSDKWLQHEIEDGYRDNNNLNATVDTSVQIRTIAGNNIFFIGIYGGKSYTWVGNGSVVIEVSCSSCPNTMPEPLEIVQAYLTKYPSVITLTDSVLKSRMHSEQWIKDEMDRRLWLSDKWFMQLQLRKIEEKQANEEAVKSMNIFLDYREKYFGSLLNKLKAADEKNLLATYLRANNTASIQAKLQEYKTWWIAHKTDSIILP